MPTVFSHAAVPLALGIGLGRRAVSRPLMWAGVAASMVPDLDVVSFRLGVPYGSFLGHRGFTHSLLFAIVLGALGAWAHRALRTSFSRAFLFLAVSTASHGALDAFTTGGSGIAFLWPWSEERFFAPIRIIEVSPIGLGPFLSARGATVMLSELRWVWLPFAVLGLTLAICRQACPDADRGQR